MINQLVPHTHCHVSTLTGHSQLIALSHKPTTEPMTLCSAGTGIPGCYLSQTSLLGKLQCPLRTVAVEQPSKNPIVAPMATTCQHPVLQYSREGHFQPKEKCEFEHSHIKQQYISMCLTLMYAIDMCSAAKSGDRSHHWQSKSDMVVGADVCKNT